MVIAGESARAGTHDYSPSIVGAASNPCSTILSAYYPAGSDKGTVIFASGTVTFFAGVVRDAKRWLVPLGKVAVPLCKGCHMPNKVLRCGDIMPGCDTVIEGKTEDEVFAKAEEHARKEHNMTIILPSTMREIGAAIHDKT